MLLGIIFQYPITFNTLEKIRKAVSHQEMPIPYFMFALSKKFHLFSIPPKQFFNACKIILATPLIGTYKLLRQ